MVSFLSKTQRTNSMEGDKHFSHDHSLTSFVDNEVDDYEHEQPSYLCNICGLPILSSPSYTCTTNGCNFFLHKPCAQLPKELYHPKHDPDPFRKKTLHLKPKLPSGQNFTYKCDGCEFDIHPLFVLSVEIKSKHKSHQAHPLVAIRKEISSQCDACGEKQNGFFFSCQECNFWIHQDCTLLSSFAKLPSHPDLFILTYSLPTRQLYDIKCVICNRLLHPRCSDGVYFHIPGKAFAHVSCAKSSMEVLDTDSIRSELIQLTDEEDAFPSLVIRRYLERNPLTQHNDEEYHKHPLIIDDGVSSSSTDSESSFNLMCDVCIQPISTSSPFYRCLDCDFLAHVVCADHLCRVKKPFGQRYRETLCPDLSNLVFNSIFPCFLCRRPCNGLCYYCDSKTFGGLYFIDPECMAARALNTIKHASHKRHVLSQAVTGPGTSFSCCSGMSYVRHIYSCLFCNFFIHVRCALLPKRTQHNQFDEHPLELITQTHHHQSVEEKYYYFCEVCEEDIDHKYWYYGCHKCGNYFHINCIPSVGYLSKVKFGKTLVDNSIHPHLPLTLTRMLTHGRHEQCGYCNQIIKGFVDEMAFRCSDCDFWIHFFCAWDATDKTSRARLAVYSDVEKINERAILKRAQVDLQ